MHIYDLLSSPLFYELQVTSATPLAVPTPGNILTLHFHYLLRNKYEVLKLV